MKQPTALQRTGAFSSSVFGGAMIHPIVLAVVNQVGLDAITVTQGASQLLLVRLRWVLRDVAGRRK